MGNLAKNILSGAVGYGISEVRHKKKLKNSSLEEYIKKYIDVHGVEDMQEFVDELRNLANYYEQQNNLLSYEQKRKA